MQVAVLREYRVPEATIDTISRWFGKTFAPDIDAPVDVLRWAIRYLTWPRVRKLLLDLQPVPIVATVLAEPVNVRSVALIRESAMRVWEAYAIRQNVNAIDVDIERDPEVSPHIFLACAADAALSSVRTGLAADEAMTGVAIAAVWALLPVRKDGDVIVQLVMQALSEEVSTWTGGWFARRS